MPAPLLVASRQLILPKPTLYVYDSFDRADNAASLGNADSGQAWTNVVGTWGINNNAAQLVTSAAQDMAKVQSNVYNCIIGCTLDPVGANSHRVVFRINGGDYIFAQSEAGAQYKFYTYISGGFAQIAVASFTPTNGDRLLIVCAGSYLALYVNGVFLFEATNSTNLTSTEHGIGGANNTGVGSRWQDFFVADLRDLKWVLQMHRQGTIALRR